MEIVKKKISELIPSEYNPRIISEQELERLENSMEKLKILKKKGIIEIECVVVDLDEYQEKALNLALNKISGDWDEKLLEDLLIDIKNNNFDLIDFTGFNEEELDMYFKIGVSSGLETEGRHNVITVEPPNAPVLKERASIYIEDENEYFILKEIFKKDKRLIIDKLMELK